MKSQTLQSTVADSKGEDKAKEKGMGSQEIETGSKTQLYEPISGKLRVHALSVMNGLTQLCD